VTLLPLTLVAIVAGLLLLASWTDLTRYRISNWIPLAIFGLFPPYALSVGLSMNELVWHGIAFAITLGAGFALFTWNKCGGGDVKLLAVVALWAGWGTPLVNLVTLTAIFGAVLSLGILLCRWTAIGGAIDSVLRVHGWEFAVFDPAKKVAPYAVAISGAFFVVLFVPS